MKKTITEKEDSLEKLQEQLCLEEIYSNPIESNRVNKEIKAIEEEISSLYSEWEDLAE